MEIVETRAAVTRRWVPGILNLPLGYTPLDTPCSPRGGRRIEDASRRHTAAPHPINFLPQKCIQNFIDFLIDF